MDRTYDDDNRLTFVDGPGTADDVTIVYDALGRIETQSVPGTVLTFDYEGSRLASRTETVTGHTYVSRYTYDLHDNLKTLTYPPGEWSPTTTTSSSG